MLDGVSEVFSVCGDMEESAFTGLGGHFLQRSFVRRKLRVRGLGSLTLATGLQELRGGRAKMELVAGVISSRQAAVPCQALASGCPLGTIKQFRIAAVEAGALC